MILTYVIKFVAFFQILSLFYSAFSLNFAFVYSKFSEIKPNLYKQIKKPRL